MCKQHSELSIAGRHSSLNYCNNLFLGRTLSSRKTLYGLGGTEMWIHYLTVHLVSIRECTKCLTCVFLILMIALWNINCYNRRTAPMHLHNYRQISQAITICLEVRYLLTVFSRSVCHCAGRDCLLTLSL